MASRMIAGKVQNEVQDEPGIFCGARKEVLNKSEGHINKSKGINLKHWLNLE